NYLAMLTERWGNYGRDLAFLKDCALSSINGDCRLLEKIYFASENPEDCPIKMLDRNRKKLEYVDENNEIVIDPQGLRLAKILANNLQNSYLQGVNYLINLSMEDKQSSKPAIEDYDVQCWNDHIYALSDLRYQKKIISSLE